MVHKVIIDQEPQIGKASKSLPYQSRGERLNPDEDDIAEATADLVEEIKNEYPDAAIKEVNLNERMYGDDNFKVEIEFTSIE